MASIDNEASTALIRKLDRLGQLDSADRDGIRSLPFRRSSVGSNFYVVREGETVTECCLLIGGYVCRNKLVGNGGRQILSFHLPGDLLDVQHLLLARADHNVQTITPAVLACVPLPELHALLRERPAVAQALWRDSLIDASVFREWVLNVGRRDAKSRVAHMLCEFAVRREAAGLGEPERFELPMSQEQIADATGLTPVHVNRMLAALRADGVISHQGRHLQITDWAGMRVIADFDPMYLHAAA